MNLAHLNTIKNNRTWLIILGCFVIITFLYFQYSTKEINTSTPITESKHCILTDNSPVLINIRTKLGVNYDAGHWFHMAENIMVQHSIMRARHGLFNTSEIVYNFDQNHFITNLNSITRFIVYMGTVNTAAKTERLIFTNNDVLFSHKPLPGKNILLNSHEIYPKEHNIVVLNRTGSNNFAHSDANHYPPQHHSKEMCVKYGGTIGGMWPTPQRGSWFPKDGDIDAFRLKIANVCKLKSNNPQPPKRKYKLVLYQRDLSRKLANQEEALSNIRERLSDKWEIEVLMHSKKRGPCELAHYLQSVDVLLTPHGFQSMLLIFLPPKAILFEIFPYRYYKRGYGPLSKEFDIVHTGVMSPATIWYLDAILRFVKTSWCMESKICRGYARDQDVLLTNNGVRRLINTINDRYQEN